MTGKDHEPLRIAICVGISCYVRASDHVGALLASLIQKHELQDEVEIMGAFCMDRCSMGVSAKVRHGPCSTLSLENATAFFEREILPSLRGER